MSISFSDALQAGVRVRLYGDPIKDPPISAELFKGLSIPTKAEFALVRSYSVAGYCRMLPVPVMMLVPGEAKDVSPSDDCAGDSSKFWQVGLGATALTIDFDAGEIGELLEEIELRGIKGGVTFRNVRVEDGKLRGDIHVWAEIKLPFKKWKVKETIPFSIPIRGCYTIWDIGVASVKLCARAPNQLCAEFCIGKWGIEKCWPACVDVNLPLASATEHEAIECGCVAG